MNLYQKYRPREFSDIIGNDAEIESLKTVMGKRDRPHVYLLSGPSGCGKTTLARIAARMVGAGELSITEINTANNRGIDTAREIIQNMEYFPTDGDSRVYIIDECHQTTKDWQNAMLKPLEDTPDHVYFFLCTTDPAKLLPTIKNRCSQFKVSALKSDQLYKLLRRVHKKEEGNLSKEILQDISDAGEGSPRKALVLLDKVIGLGDEEKIADIISMGEETEAQVIELCRSLLKRSSWGEIAKIIKGLSEIDPEKIRWAVMGYMNSVLLSGKSNGQAAWTLECFSEPFYSSGRNGVTLAANQSTFGGDDIPF